MGKFNLKKVEEYVEKKEISKQYKIKKRLRSKPLLDPILSDSSPTAFLQDGTLLFGKHSGKKISELMSDYRNSSYVTNYLLVNKDLPRQFREQISEILDNYNPIDFDASSPFDGLNVREVSDDEMKEDEFDGDDIPWGIVLFFSISLIKLFYIGGL